MVDLCKVHTMFCWRSSLDWLLVLKCTRCFDGAFGLLRTIAVVKWAIGANCTHCVEVGLRLLSTIAVVKPTICASAPNVWRAFSCLLQTLDRRVEQSAHHVLTRASAPQYGWNRWIDYLCEGAHDVLSFGERIVPECTQCFDIQYGCSR